MKKLSFFLMAMLFSVMSFAQDTPVYELVPKSGSNNGYASNCDITIDGITWNLTGNSTMQPWRIGGKNLTSQDRALYSKTPLAYNIDKIEVTHGTANSITVNSFKLIISDEANGAGETIDVAFVANATTTIDLPEGDYTNKYFKFLYNVTVGSSNKYVQFTGAKFYAALAEDAVKAPIIDGDADFISETEVTIEAEDDVTVYYTLDGTDPTTASTVYAAPFTVKETTTVKAIAYRGETASFVTSATFTQATRVTAAEAAELAMKVASNNALTSVTYVINAYVTEVIDQTLSSGQQRFWVADTKDGGQVLQSYYCNVPQVLKVGDYIQMFGKLTKFNTNPQMKNGDVTIAEEPVIEEPTIECKDALDFGAVAYNAEVAAQTLEVAAYNLTSDITVTLSEGAAFIVDQTTLSAEGGNLVVTPVSPLTVGTHNATLTLASGEATAEVTLTIVAKDVYTIAWYVNGELYDETTVVEGDNLVLPVAPEAPEACSEKVFVGWTAAEEVNTDGSEIEWVTAATAPTAAATYYAVFAAQEGEGGQEEVSASVTIADYATANSWTNGEQYPSITIDTNITATAAGESNTGKYYTSGNQWRFYQGEGATLTITAAEGITISTVAVTYAIQNTGILTLDGVNIESEAICNINASSVTFGVGNTGSVANGQVRVTKINVTYFAGAAATYTDYSTTCEPEIPTVTLSCTGMDKNYQAWRDLLQLEGTSTNDEYVTVALYNYAATVGDYQASIAFGDLELETESLTINRGSEEWTLTATIDADTAIYEFTATTAAPKTETIAPRAATWGGDAMNGYIIDCTTTSGNVQISVMDGTEYGMGWMLNMAINDALVVEGATIDAPTWEEDNLVLDVTVVSGTLDEYTIQLTATPKPATEIIANATMALSEDEYEVGTMIVSATWEEHPLSVKLNGWPYYGYGEYAEANLIIEIDPENYDFVDAYSTATLEKKEDVAVLTGTFSDWNGNKYALTLTIAEPAAAPVVETVNVVCTDMVQGEEWGTPVLTGTCNLGDINISLNLEKTDHPESVYGEYGFAEYPMGLFPTVEVTIEGEDSFIMLELMENTVAVYTDGETQDSFVGTFLGSDWKVYVLDMKTPAPEGPSAVDNITTTVAPVKAIVNGQLVIVKDGVQYNAQGAVIK